ncbi:MAG: triose-phosphate isomerase [Wenzhouxiangella sp.]
MRRPLIAGNWKMNGREAEIRDLLAGIIQRRNEAAGSELLVLPSYPYLPLVAGLLEDSGVAMGAQDLSPRGDGAFTGDVAAGMLIDCGCRYVLVGHSERRSVHGESDELVADKFAAALAAGLRPVLCVGESLAERESEQTAAVVQRQLGVVMEKVGIAAFGEAVVAYEPVWAIGTGRSASPAQAQEVHALIRSQLAGEDATIAGQVRILYGGSVKPDNAAELFACEDIDGGLIGGASLQAQSFMDIAAASGPAS